MIDHRTLRTEFGKLIRWQPEYSSTGRHYEDFHPLLTKENMKSVAPMEGDFDAWLRQKTEAGISRAVSDLQNMKLVEGTLKGIMERRQLFTGAGRIKDLIRKDSFLVGFEMVPVRSEGVVVKIHSAGFQYVNGEGEPLRSLRIYVFHSDSFTPQTFELTFPEEHRNGQMEWNAFEDQYFFLPCIGGSWYIVYDQRELGDAQAVRYDRDWSRRPCASCVGPYEMQSYNIWSRWLEMHPFFVREDFYPEENHLWDVRNNEYRTSINWGLNFIMSIECDITDLILQHTSQFADTVGYSVALQCLDELYYNASARVTRTQKVHQVKVEEEERTELRKRRDEAMQAVSLDLSNYNSVCLPCRKRLEFGAI